MPCACAVDNTSTMSDLQLTADVHIDIGRKESDGTDVDVDVDMSIQERVVNVYSTSNPPLTQEEKPPQSEPLNIPAVSVHKSPHVKYANPVTEPDTPLGLCTIAEPEMVAQKSTETDSLLSYAGDTAVQSDYQGVIHASPVSSREISGDTVVLSSNSFEAESSAISTHRSADRPALEQKSSNTSVVISAQAHAHAHLPTIRDGLGSKTNSTLSAASAARRSQGLASLAIELADLKQSMSERCKDNTAVSQSAVTAAFDAMRLGVSKIVAAVDQLLVRVHN